MGWSSYFRNGGEHLGRYPELRRWINQCVACGRQGRKRDLPEQIGKHQPNFAAPKLRRFFDPLDVDENGLCDQCRAATASKPDKDAP